MADDVTAALARLQGLIDRLTADARDEDYLIEPVRRVARMDLAVVAQAFAGAVAQERERCAQAIQALPDIQVKPFGQETAWRIVPGGVDRSTAIEAIRLRSAK